MCKFQLALLLLSFVLASAIKPYVDVNPPPPGGASNPWIKDVNVFFSGQFSNPTTYIDVQVGNNKRCPLVMQNGLNGATNVNIELQYRTNFAPWGNWYTIGTQTIPFLEYSLTSYETLTFTKLFSNNDFIGGWPNWVSFRARVVNLVGCGNMYTSDDMGFAEASVRLILKETKDSFFKIAIYNDNEDPKDFGIDVRCPGLNSTNAEAEECGDLVRLISDGVYFPNGTGMSVGAFGEMDLEFQIVGDLPTNKILIATRPQIVLDDGTVVYGPSESETEFVFEEIDEVTTALDEPRLCCLKSVKHRVLLETILADASELLAGDNCKRAMRLFRRFLQQAEALYCELNDEEIHCLKDAMERILKLARIIATDNLTTSNAACVRNHIGEGDLMMSQGLFQAALVEYAKSCDCFD